MTLKIYGRLDGLNEYTKACRTNMYAGNNMKSINEAKITACIKEQLKGIHFENPVCINFRWYEPNKKRDLDNICFAKKFVLDALKNNKVIQNDGWAEVIGFTDSFFIDKENPRIEVDIERG